jgi:MSHA pilin protein MshD
VFCIKIYKISNLLTYLLNFCILKLAIEGSQIFIDGMRIKGISLIEMIAVIVVLAIAIPTLLAMLADVGWRSGRREAMADTLLYVQELMEEIVSKDFEDPDQTPVFGPETGETSRSDYDDVDDFDDYSDNPAPGYDRSVNVDYVELISSTWQSAASSTDFKRVTVTVGRDDNLISEVSSLTIKASY